MTQTELFPMTQLDIAQAFLNHFEEEVEKRTKSMLSAQAKLTEALELRKMAEAELRRAQDHVPSGPIANAAEALKAAAQANGFGVTFAAGGEEVVVCEPAMGSGALTVDMDTGEVTPTVSTTAERTCPECEHHGNCDTEGEGNPTCYKPGRRP